MDLYEEIAEFFEFFSLFPNTKDKPLHTGRIPTVQPGFGSGRRRVFLTTHETPALALMQQREGSVYEWVASAPATLAGAANLLVMHLLEHLVSPSDSTLGFKSEYPYFSASNVASRLLTLYVNRGNVASLLNNGAFFSKGKHFSWEGNVEGVAVRICSEKFGLYVYLDGVRHLVEDQGEAENTVREGYALIPFPEVGKPLLSVSVGFDDEHSLSAEMTVKMQGARSSQTKHVMSMAEYREKGLQLDRKAKEEQPL